MPKVFIVTLPDETSDGHCYSASDVAAAIAYSHLWAAVDVLAEAQLADGAAGRG